MICHKIFLLSSMYLIHFSSINDLSIYTSLSVLTSISHKSVPMTNEKWSNTDSLIIETKSFLGTKSLS